MAKGEKDFETFFGFSAAGAIGKTVTMVLRYGEAVETGEFLGLIVLNQWGALAVCRVEGAVALKSTHPSLLTFTQSPAGEV